MTTNRTGVKYFSPIWRAASNPFTHGQNNQRPNERHNLEYCCALFILHWGRNKRQWTEYLTTGSIDFFKLLLRLVLMRSFIHPASQEPNREWNNLDYFSPNRAANLRLSDAFYEYWYDLGVWYKWMVEMVGDVDGKAIPLTYWHSPQPESQFTKHTRRR